MIQPVMNDDGQTRRATKQAVMEQTVTTMTTMTAMTTTMTTTTMPTTGGAR